MFAAEQKSLILHTPSCRNRGVLWSLAAERAPAAGYWLEFGVSKGRSLNGLAELTHKTVYGFDTFEGLPEAWDVGPGIRRHEIGHFAGWPQELEPNTHLVVGLFADTLPAWLDSNPDPVALLHVDSDLYSSAATVLENLQARLQPGTVIIFDEIWNYPNYASGEMLAWQELLSRVNLVYEWFGHVPNISAAGVQVWPDA